MKPRSDSKLKTLPAERQADIAAYAFDHSLADTVKWLAADGLQTSAAALSEFLSWHSLQQQLLRNESTVQELLEDLKRSDPTITSEQLDLAGQMFFTKLAIEQKDSLSWQRAQNVKIKQGALALEARRILLLEKKAAAFDAAKKVVESKLSPEEQRQRLKEILK